MKGKGSTGDARLPAWLLHRPASASRSFCSAPRWRSLVQAEGVMEFWGVFNVQSRWVYSFRH